MISAYFPPCTKIGGKRAQKIAQSLHENGYSVTVLTLDDKITSPSEKIRNKKNYEFEVKRIKKQSLYLYLKNRKSKIPTKYDVSEVAAVPRRRVIGMTKNYIRQYLLRVIRCFEKIDYLEGWSKTAFSLIKKERKNYDIVFVTGPPFSSVYLGKKIADYLDSKFVIDYRDPWTDIPEFTFVKRNLNIIENECLDRADLVYVVSPGIEKILAKKSIIAPIICLEQGYVEEMCPNKNPCENYFLYAGSLAYGRSLVGFFEFLKSFIIKTHNSTKLVYCGPHGANIMEQARLSNCSALLVNMGEVSEEKVKQLSGKSIANVIVVSEGYEYAYPGKLFDLIPSKRPIIVVASLDNCASDFVIEYNLGFSLFSGGSSNCTDEHESHLTKEFIVDTKLADFEFRKLYKNKLVNNLSSLDV